MKSDHSTPATHAKLLNRGDLAELRAHAHLIPGFSPHLELIEQKVDAFPESFGPDLNRRYDYASNAALAVLSHFPRADDLVQCRRWRFGRENVPCDCVEFCPYCNWIAAERLRRQYAPQFDQATWWFVTLSFHAKFGFSAEKFELLQLGWEAGGQALTALVADGLAEGALWVEELAVTQFLPLRVLPHVHAVVVADACDAGTEERLRERMQAARFHGRSLGCAPDVRFRSIPSEIDLNYSLGYLAKPVDVATPYAAAWQAKVRAQPKLAFALNEEASTFCSGLPQVGFDRSRFDRKGRLHPAHKRTLTTREAGPSSSRPVYRPRGNISGEST